MNSLSQNHVTSSGSADDYILEVMMKAKFTLTTSTNTPELLGLTNTPLLILGKLQAIGLGNHIQSLDHSLGGAISEKVQGLNFRGERGESFLLNLDQEGAPENVLVVGLGSLDKFDHNAIKHVVEMAVDAAIAKGLTKITFPMPPNRQTKDINLRGQANIIRLAVEKKLREHKGRGELEIEILSAPQAKAQLARGLACKRSSEDGTCCDDKK
jgi:hypothetical protein